MVLKTRIRTLHIINVLQIGGAEVDCVRKLKGLKYDLDSTVCCLIRSGPLAEPLENEGIPVVGPLMPHRYDIGCVLKVRKLLQQGWNAVHSHLYASNLITALAISTMPKNSRPTFIATDHMMAERHSQASIRLCRFILRTADVMFTPSQTALESFQKRGLNSEKLQVMPNMLDIAPFKSIERKAARLALVKELGIPEDTSIVGTVCRLEAIKGVDVLIEAVRGLPVHLVVVGEGSAFGSLKAQVKHLGLTDRVRFLGSRGDIQHLMSAFDLYVSPSRSESFGIAIAEALAAKTPVISTAVGAAPEILGNGLYGELVEPNRPNALAEKIKNSIAQGRNNDRIEAGFKSITSFTPEVLLPKLTKLYSQRSL